MKRRFISAVLAFTIIISSVLCFDASAVFAAEESGYCGYSSSMTGTGKNATYKYSAATKTLTISGTGATKNYGNTVSNSRPWDDFRDNITTVIVEEGITEIGTLNFYNFPVLTNVSLPSTLEKLVGKSSVFTNYGAFRGCTALESITLPEGLKTIDDYVFVDCTALKTVKFPETLTSIGEEAFRGCTSLQNVRFPNSVTSLGNYAFRECKELTSVTYGTGMTSTGKYAFYDCENLNRINFSSTITAIDQYSFYNTRITTIEIPETITSIGTRAFANCSFITKVTVYNSNCSFEGIKLGSSGQDPFNGSSQTITFYGHKGSTTETYANEKGYIFVSLDDCEHANTHIEIIPPTCTEKGVQKTICDDCDIGVVSEVELAPTDHAWKVVDTEDASTTDGHIYTYYVCVNNGCDEEQTIIEHKAFIEGFYEYTKEGNCTIGYEKKSCIIENCGKVERTPLIGGNHQVDNYVVEKDPTCTEPGTQKGDCTVCGKTVESSIPASGHKNAVLETIDNTEIDGHTYIIYQCSVCDEKTEEPTHVEWIEGYYTSSVVTAPRCVLSGLGRDSCNKCSETRLVELPANGQHEWYETTREEPECAKVGTIYYSCKNCNLSKKESIPALGHDYVLQESISVAPTCVDAGYNVRKCDTCGMTSTEVVQATGHTIDETNYLVTKEANCEEDGAASSVCTVCNTPFDLVIEKLGHNMEAVVTPIDDKPGHSLSTPSCTRTRCNQIDPATVIHDEWVEGYYTEVFKEGTCLKASEYTKSCTLCSKTETQRGEITGHKYQYSKTENNGTLVYSCVNCDNSRTYNPTYVSGLFPQYINTNVDDTALGYLFELNKDGVINAKDYSMINKAVVQSKAYN